MEAQLQLSGFEPEKITEFVSEPTWREVLLEAIDSQKMDPWDVDVAKIADAYLKKVKQLQELDLRVPANVILASALLLHYKAQALNLEDEKPAEAVVRPLIQEAIPELVYNPNVPKSRTVTLEELVSAVEEVMQDGKRELIPRRIQLEPISIELPKENMSDWMEKVYGKALEMRDSKGIVLFSELSRQFNGHGEPKSQVVAQSLIPLLHLVQELRLMAWQEKLFGEIFIKVV